MHPTRQSRFFTLATVLLAAAGLACATTIPLPPELKDAEVIATTGRTRIIVMGKVKPPSMKPYVLQDLQTGSGSTALSHLANVFGAAIGYEWRHVDGGFSFRLEKEGSEPGTLGNVTCVWGLATISGGFSAGKYGAEFKIPSGSSLFCEFLPTMGIEEPWKLLLWTGAPSNPIVRTSPREECSPGATSGSPGLCETTTIGAAWSTSPTRPRYGQAHGQIRKGASRIFR